MERRLRVEPCEPALAVLTTSKRTGHSIKMRRSLAQFSGLESSVHVDLDHGGAMNRVIAEHSIIV